MASVQLVRGLGNSGTFAKISILILLLTMAWVATPAFADEPPNPCIAYANNPAAQKVYVLPKLGEPGHEVHCDVTGMAIAVHDGDFRSLYGGESYPATDPKNAQIIEDILERTIGYLRAQAQQAFDRDTASKARCTAGSGCEVDLKILVFAHGGLVAQSNGLDEAETMAPGMLADGFAPLFLIWNSDFPGAYGERLCCVLEGQQSKRGLLYFLPARLAGDIVSSAARAPEYFGQQILRFQDSVTTNCCNQYYLNSADPQSLCKALDGEACPKVIYPYFRDENDNDGELNGRDQPAVEHSMAYRVGFPARWLTTETITQVGAEAWGDMVRRTRLALQSPMIDVTRNFSESTNEDVCAAQTRVKLSRLAPAINEPSTAQFAPSAEGGFGMLFDRLECAIQYNQLDFGALEPLQRVKVNVKIYYYGHSMGAIVGDELLASHPKLPWKRIVYMAAAASVRDFRTAAVPLLICGSQTSSRACPPGQGAPRFYNLMLHPLAESHDLEAYGIVPEGSLLEWIDEMFGGPKSLDDRTLGKWTNVKQTISLFPPQARLRMWFRVFPDQAEMRQAKFPNEREAYAAECTAGPTGTSGKPAPLAPRCHPITHGDFTNYSFWRDFFLCGPTDCALEEESSAGNSAFALH